MTLLQARAIAPLLLIGLPPGVGHMLRGDRGPVMILAAAALVCGPFWEFWNFRAMPKWIYPVPWLDRLKLFEMPLVGYLGYLPSGPACWALWLLLRRRPARHPGEA